MISLLKNAWFCHSDVGNICCGFNLMWLGRADDQFLSDKSHAFVRSTRSTSSRSRGPFCESEQIVHCGSCTDDSVIIIFILKHTAPTAPHPSCAGIRFVEPLSTPLPLSPPPQGLNHPTSRVLGPLPQCAAQVLAFPLCAVTWGKLRKPC